MSRILTAHRPSCRKKELDLPQAQGTFLSETETFRAERIFTSTITAQGATSLTLLLRGPRPTNHRNGDEVEQGQAADPSLPAMGNRMPSQALAEIHFG